MNKAIYILFLASLTILSACKTDPATEQALENTKQIKALHDELDQKFKASEKVLEEMDESQRSPGGIKKISPSSKRFRDSLKESLGMGEDDSLKISVEVREYVDSTK